MKPLLKKLNYQFKKQTLLTQALTHPSAGLPHNQRLEFVGDSVLGLVIADILYQKYPGIDEGQLSQLRAQLVNKQTLAHIAQTLSLGNYLSYNVAQNISEQTGPLADALEALLAAIYYDGGFLAAQQIIHTLWHTRLAKITPTTLPTNYKSALQTYCQQHKVPLPHYQAHSEGPDHALTFYVNCQLTTPQHITHAKAATKQQAQHLAAEKMLDWLEKNS